MAKTIWRQSKEDMTNDEHLAGGEGEQGRKGLGVEIAQNDKAQKDDKLEVKLQGAWYAAELSLREDGITTVQFEGYSDDEEEWNAEKIKSFKPIRDHIRVVSTQLQDEECGLVHLNKTVCALRKAGSKEGCSEGWHDAVVTAVRSTKPLKSVLNACLCPLIRKQSNVLEPLIFGDGKVRKRPHRIQDKGEICTCSFGVVWLDGPAKGQGRKLRCEDICLLSTKDVETHPLIADILRYPNDRGSRKEQEEELPTFSAPKMRRREGKTDDFIGSLEEQQQVHQFKRLKSKATNLGQVRMEPDTDAQLIHLVNDQLAPTSHDKGIQDVRSSSHSVEQKRATKFSAPTEQRMRGQIQFQKENPFSSNADPLRGVTLRRKSGTGPSGIDHMNQEVRNSPNADALQADSARGKTFMDLTEDEDCKLQVKKEIQSSEKRPGSLTLEVGDLDEEEHSCAKADPMPEVHIKQKRPEIVGPISEGWHSKKLRITVDFDIDTGNGKITSYSANCEQPLDPAGNPWAKVKARRVEASGPKSEALTDPDHNYPPGPKDEEFLQSSLKDEKVREDEREEPSGPVRESFEGPVSRREALRGFVNNDFEEPKTNSSAQQVADHSSNEEPVDSKCQTRLGSAAKNAICLSDEEDDCVIAGSTPPTSSKEFSNHSSEDDPLTDQQEGWHVHLDDRTRYLRSTFVKNALTKLGCILQIDNLEVGVKPIDLMEMLLKFCDKERIQSVQIPPPYPQMNRARGFVIFVDKEAADAAAGVLSSGVVISARGRPWCVNRPGQEESGSPKPSVFMGAHDGKAISSGGFKLVTRKQLSEYNAAKQLLRVFEEHRKQARVMFQRHSQEEKDLDADRDTSLDF